MQLGPSSVRNRASSLSTTPFVYGAVYRQLPRKNGKRVYPATLSWEPNPDGPWGSTTKPAPKLEPMDEESKEEGHQAEKKDGNGDSMDVESQANEEEKAEKAGGDAAKDGVGETDDGYEAGTED